MFGNKRLKNLEKDVNKLFEKQRGWTEKSRKIENLEKDIEHLRNVIEYGRLELHKKNGKYAVYDKLNAYYAGHCPSFYDQYIYIIQADPKEFDTIAAAKEWAKEYLKSCKAPDKGNIEILKI